MSGDLRHLPGDVAEVIPAPPATMTIFRTQFMGLDLWYSLLLIIVQVWDTINAPRSAPRSTPIAVSAVMQFIGLSLVYNLDKKTTAKMTKELNARHEAAAKERTDFYHFHEGRDAAASLLFYSAPKGNLLQKMLSCGAALCYSKVINYGIF